MVCAHGTGSRSSVRELFTARTPGITAPFPPDVSLVNVFPLLFNAMWDRADIHRDDLFVASGNVWCLATDEGAALAPLLLLFVLSGAAGLIYEVVWARQLVLVFGNTSQAVSTILTGFFGGLAIGGAVGGRIADRVARPLRMYGVLELILVVIVVLTPLSFRLIGEVYRGIYPGAGGDADRARARPVPARDPRARARDAC